MSRLADVLSLLRLGVACVFPAALAHGGALPIALFAFAAASDYVDGPLARRGGRPLAWGSVLDNVADVAFVLGAAVAGACLGWIGWWTPAAIAASVTGYVLASRQLTATASPAATGGPRLARSRVGHAAGVVNYVLAGCLAGTAGAPAIMPAVAVPLASGAVVVVNGAAVLLRLLPDPTSVPARP